MKGGKEASIIKSPKWVAIISSVSIGWLIFFISTFYSAMAIGTILNSINEPIITGPAVISTIIVASLLGILLGGIIGKGLYRWFCNRKRSIGIILCIILVLLVFGLIPQYIHICKNVVKNITADQPLNLSIHP